MTIQELQAPLPHNRMDINVMINASTLANYVAVGFEN